MTTLSMLPGVALTSRALLVRVIDGADRGLSLDWPDGTLWLGGDPSCQLRLTDPTVSRRHASLAWSPSGIAVSDLGSKNGTWYQGARGAAFTLPLGSSFRLGNTTLAVLPPEVAEGTLSPRQALAGLLGRSPGMRQLFAQVERVADSDAATLIHGETGTGKEGVARALHTLGRRARGPLVVVDCGTLSRELAASHLFGHVAGSFTGAVKDRPGALSEAGGGTLFLDEVGELPLELQPVFLRALDTQRFLPVGANHEKHSDFRLVCATHRDLPALVEQGRFRRDLYHRLATVTLTVPPLRDRLDDIPLLAEHFSAQARGAPLEPHLLAALAGYHWPGNVRELKNAVERILALGPEAIAQQPLPQGSAYKDARDAALRGFERAYVARLLATHKTVAEAARAAGIARSYLYRLLEEHALLKDTQGSGRA